MSDDLELYGLIPVSQIEKLINKGKAHCRLAGRCDFTNHEILKPVLICKRCKSMKLINLGI